ncbi:hypothetical protein GOODEAATRI_012719, partial [Goodea atripinnis]
QSYQSLDGRLKLAVQPQSQRLHVGETLQMECGAVGRPVPRYQWHKNGVPILNATKRKLIIPLVKQDHHGRYRCEISGSTERMWTNEVDVVIDDIYAIEGVSCELFLNSLPEQLYGECLIKVHFFTDLSSAVCLIYSFINKSSI